jgi:hypothetical protein
VSRPPKRRYPPRVFRERILHYIFSHPLRISMLSPRHFGRLYHRSISFVSLYFYSFEVPAQYSVAELIWTVQTTVAFLILNLRIYLETWGGFVGVAAVVYTGGFTLFALTAASSLSLWRISAAQWDPITVGILRTHSDYTLLLLDTLSLIPSLTTRG